jgi:hypothetical protein
MNDPATQSPIVNSPAIETTTNETLGPWEYADVGPHIRLNEMTAVLTNDAVDARCTYTGGLDGNTPVFTLLVVCSGYQSVLVSNVLIIPTPTDACGNPASRGSAPAPQIVNVSLTPL